MWQSGQTLCVGFLILLSSLISFSYARKCGSQRAPIRATQASTEDARALWITASDLSMTVISLKWFIHSLINGDSGENLKWIIVFLAAVKPANMIFLRANLMFSLRAESSLNSNKVGCLGIGNFKFFSDTLPPYSKNQRLRGIPKTHEGMYPQHSGYI